MAAPDRDGLMCTTYGSLFDLGRLVGLDDPVDDEGNPLDGDFVHNAIRALEAVALVRNDEGARRIVLMR